MTVLLASGAVQAVPGVSSAGRTMAAGAVPAGLTVMAGLLLAGHVPATGFLAVAVLIGLPHGAFDHEVGRRVFTPRHRERWWRPFLAGYLALLGVTLMLWWAVPGVALASFLLLSIVHFGDADAPAIAPAWSMRMVAHGGTIVIVAAATHPDALDELFAILAPTSARWIEAILSGPLLWLWLAAAIGTLAVYVRHGRPEDHAAAVDLVLVTLLFALVPPLIAFSLYFAALHTPRAFAELRSVSSSGRISSMPVLLTLLAATFGGVLYLYGSHPTPGTGIIHTVFLLLSALTVPHMWLERRAQSMLSIRQEV